MKKIMMLFFIVLMGYQSLLALQLNFIAEGEGEHKLTTPIMIEMQSYASKGRSKVILQFWIKPGEQITKSNIVLGEYRGLGAEAGVNYVAFFAFNPEGKLIFGSRHDAKLSGDAYNIKVQERKGLIFQKRRKIDFIVERKMLA